MPEGHSIHRIARQISDVFTGERVRVSSPQGRFTDGAALLDGHTITGAYAHGKHLFVTFENDLTLNVHLGIYGNWSFGGDETFTGASSTVSYTHLTYMKELNEFIARADINPKYVIAKPGRDQSDTAAWKNSILDSLEADGHRIIHAFEDNEHEVYLRRGIPVTWVAPIRDYVGEWHYEPVGIDPVAWADVYKRQG